MKKASYLEIGEQFKRKANILEGYKSGYFREFKTLRECYDRWSDAKEYIYNKYYDLLLNNCDRVIDYGVRSYNSMIIVLHALVIKNGVKYYLMITPSYNYYVEIEEA